MDDPKTQLSQLLQKQCGRALNKDDVVYLVSRYNQGSQYQAVVRLDCLDSREYAGEVCTDQKGAERSAAEQAVKSLEDALEALQKRKAGPDDRSAKRLKDDNGLDNPAVTPKTQLNSFVMKIVKRYLQKGETVYDCNKVGQQYQATVRLTALPGDWGEREWAGHLCSTKQKAEQSAAEEAYKDIQEDPELAAEAAKPKGGGKSKGKGKLPKGGGFGGYGDYGDFGDYGGYGAYGCYGGYGAYGMGWSSWGSWKGKGKKGGCDGESDGNVGDRSFNQGIGLGLGPPISQRERVTDAPCVGTVVEWKGTYGWLESALPIDHPLASARGGKIFVHHRDLPRGVESLLEGQPLSFHVYSDATGLGAEEVVIA